MALQTSILLGSTVGRTPIPPLDRLRPRGYLGEKQPWRANYWRTVCVVCHTPFLLHNKHLFSPKTLYGVAPLRYCASIGYIKARDREAEPTPPEGDKGRQGDIMDDIMTWESSPVGMVGMMMVKRGR